MKLNFDVSKKEFSIISTILIKHILQGTKVWIFGSRAKGQAQNYSDLDIALEYKQKIDTQILHRLKHDFEESLLPYTVDVLDINAISSSFREVIDTHKKLFSLRHYHLRFKDEQGKDYPDWEEKKLREIFDIKKGFHLSKSQLVFNGKFKAIHYGELFTKYNEVILKVLSTTNFVGFQSINGDILMPTSDVTPFGLATASALMLDNIVLGGDINILRPIIKINSIFFSYLINFYKKLIMKLVTGTTVKHIYASDLKYLLLTLPTLPEQQKIASFLQSIDTKIQLLEKKAKLLQSYKKGIMQKLFSQRLRFKDEQGKDYPDWEEKKLGEISEFYKGKGISKKDISNNGKNECIRYGELYTRYSERIETVYSKTNVSLINLFTSKQNDILIPSSGETILDLATASCILKDGIILGGDINVIRTKANGVFLAYYFNIALKNKIASLAQGISIMHLYSSKLKHLLITLPTLPEQQKIASFLSAIDTKISLTQKKVALTKQYKKGLLQRMFI